MTPAARIQATIEILGALENTAQPADRFLRDWFRARRFAGAKDRASIAERVFAVFRHRASLAFRMGSEDPRALAIASLLEEGHSLDAVTALFGSSKYAPAALSSAEQLAVLHPPQEAAPLHVRGNFPAFLEPELTRAFGSNLAAEVAALNARASIDLRVNPILAARDDVVAQLKDEGIEAHRVPYAPFGMRLASAESGPRLNRHALFLEGAFEFQDEAAQIAAYLVAARPGEKILDLAAGAGGKSLAIAADMYNRGEILACDVRARVLEELASRAVRAGLSIVRTHHVGEQPAGLFDAVLVDAPCSGTGTWRRQPDSKWRLTPERLERYLSGQDALLAQGALKVRPGGRLVYATCSMLPCENEDRISAFLSAHEAFSVAPAASFWSNLRNNEAPPPGLDRFFHASPLSTGTDGFFAAVLVRGAVI
jgi:16S rRNA (cytosine967-C5)-methyltransferase